MTKLADSTDDKPAAAVGINEQFRLERGGHAECEWIQNICTKCGWAGEKHYAYNDYQHHNCSEERRDHKCAEEAT